MNHLSKSKLACLKFLLRRIFICPGTFHEVLLERNEIRSAVLRATLMFFTQESDDVNLVSPPSPLEVLDPAMPLFSLAEVIMRSIGIGFACIGVGAGLSMMFGSRRSLGRIFG